MTVFLQHGEHALGGADRGAVGLRRVDAEAEPHFLQLGGGLHRRLAAFEDVDKVRPLDAAADDA